jgi:hypothetical protein
MFVKFALQTLGSVTLLSLQITELCSNLPQNSESSNSQLGQLRHQIPQKQNGHRKKK